MVEMGRSMSIRSFHIDFIVVNDGTILLGPSGLMVCAMLSMKRKMWAPVGHH